MLQLIRDRSQGLIVGVIVFFICLTFALFGVQQYLEGQNAVVVAEVNGEEIPLTEFQTMFQQLRQRAQAMFGESFDAERWSGSEAKMSTLDFVVNERLVLQAADEANIRASDAQIANYIRTSPQFQEEGKFSADLYRRMIRAIGFSELAFEQQVRKDLVVNQLRAGIGASAFSTAEELQAIERYRQQTRDVGFAVLNIEEFRKSVEPTPDELATFFEENAERYRTPERVALNYLDLSIESLMENVTAEEATLRDYYETRKANYTSQEQRNVNHILVQLPRDASPEEEEVALEKARMLKTLATEGDSFETVARESSDDIGSRTDGGETGFFGRGVMAPEFEEAAFAMAEGAVSDPVRTDFGFHIIRVKAIKPGGVKSFDEVKADVSAAYRREQAEALYFELGERLGELAYEQPDSLEPAADALGLAIKTTGPLTRTELADLFSDGLVDAVFEPEVLVEGLNSDPIDVSNGRVVVVRVGEHVPSRVPSLDEVRDEVRTDVIDTRAREAIAERGSAIVERLNAGEARETVLADTALEWEQHDGLTRMSDKLNRAVARAAFRADPPTTDGVAYSGVPMGTGDYAIVGVANVTLPAIEQLDVSDVGDLRREIAADRTADGWQDFIALLKSDAEVETFPERL